MSIEYGSMADIMKEEKNMRKKEMTKRKTNDEKKTRLIFRF